MALDVNKLVQKYLPVLDEQYYQESKTAILDWPREWVRDTRDAKKVKIAKYKTDKLGNYSRSKGFAKGSMDLEWEEHSFEIDRGRAIQVDHEDNEETFGMAFGRLAGEFQRHAVIPEMDAYRIAKYASKAGFKDSYNLKGTESILRKIDHLDTEMDNEGVPEEGRIIFCRPSVYEAIINDASIERKLEVNDDYTKALNKKIYSYNNHVLIKVKPDRMYTAITLLDGESDGQEEGGYVKAAGAEDLGLLMVSVDSVVQISKRNVARIWAPSREYAQGVDGVNPDADAWRFDFRIYHDAWVLDNKVKGIAALTLDNTILTPGTYTDGAFHNGAPYLVKEGKVSGTLAQGAAVPEINLSAGNRFVIKLQNPSITAKSQLPTGNCVSTYNSTTGVLNEKTRDVFEDDGSLIVVTNIESKNTVYTVKVKWSADFEAEYQFTFEGAEFPAA